jgi:hypothetical protein
MQSALVRDVLAEKFRTLEGLRGRAEPHLGHLQAGGHTVRSPQDDPITKAFLVLLR